MFPILLVILSLYQMEINCHHLFWHFLFAITTHSTICFNINNIVFSMYIKESLFITDDSQKTRNWPYIVFIILAQKLIVHIRWAYSKTYCNVFHLKNIKHCTRRYTWEMVQSGYAYKTSIVLNNLIRYSLSTKSFLFLPNHQCYRCS